jgi:7-carboxy-7-deazaguanine synthase (Cx14CxxC type)
LSNEVVMKRYMVKSLFYTLQGEGIQVGRPAVFCRFAGCNLWTGREIDRGRGGSCSAWCDTDFVGTNGPGGGQFEVEQLADAIADAWPDPEVWGLAVFTGGEPLLQLDDDLISAVHHRGLDVAVETNGTIKAPMGIDWLTVSPKAGAPLHQRSGHELKLVYPQPGIDPATFLGLDFRHFLLSPMDGPDHEANMEAALSYCLENPIWRMTTQAHKYWLIP